MTNTISVTCLGFAAIGAFLLVPDRELTIRERIGFHTIFWVFILYAMWTIYSFMWQAESWYQWDKYFYVSVPFLLGLLLIFLSELNIKRPPINVADTRVKKLTNDAWKKLPNNVRRGLCSTIMNIRSVPEWSTLDKESFEYRINTARWLPILPLPARCIIHISIADCQELSDSDIIGALVHEFARAYQSTRTPFDTDMINKAGDELPIKWGFKAIAMIEK